MMGSNNAADGSGDAVDVTVTDPEEGGGKPSEGSFAGARKLLSSFRSRLGTRLSLLRRSLAKRRLTDESRKTPPVDEMALSTHVTPIATIAAAGEPTGGAEPEVRREDIALPRSFSRALEELRLRSDVVGSLYHFSPERQSALSNPVTGFPILDLVDSVLGGSSLKTWLLTSGHNFSLRKENSGSWIARLSPTGKYSRKALMNEIAHRILECLADISMDQPGEEHSSFLDAVKENAFIRHYLLLFMNLACTHESSNPAHAGYRGLFKRSSREQLNASSLALNATMLPKMGQTLFHFLSSEEAGGSVIARLLDFKVKFPSVCRLNDARLVSNPSELSIVETVLLNLVSPESLSDRQAYSSSGLLSLFGHGCSRLFGASRNAHNTTQVVCDQVRDQLVAMQSLDVRDNNVFPMECRVNAVTNARIRTLSDQERQSLTLELTPMRASSSSSMSPSH